MSRLIPGKEHPDNTLRSTQQGKLIITSYRGHTLALLIRNNRLLHVAFMDEQTSKVGAIYLGKVKNIQKNIDACFVEIADKELIYLPLSKCKNPILTNRNFDGRILEGDEILVQIERDALKTKQAAATAKITLTGRYVVFTSGATRTGISGKLSDAEKKKLHTLLTEHGYVDQKMNWQSSTPTFSYGAVIRTEAAQAKPEALLDEIRQLETQFVSLYTKALHTTCFTCLLQPGKAWEACLEQIPSWEYEEAVTDDEALAKDMSTYFQSRNISLRLYEDDTYSLSGLYSIDTKIKEALSRRIWLKSGGYLIIDVTEALTVFDVNSGKYEAKKASDEAFCQINLEAVEEIALQIRLRNLSGIILVDFINMKDEERQEALIERMRQLVKQDRIHTTVVDITPLGLMEITRKKVNKPLADHFRKEVKP